MRNLTASDTECEEPLSFFRATEIDNIASEDGNQREKLFASGSCAMCKLSYAQNFSCPNLLMINGMESPSNIKATPLTRNQMEPYMKSLCETSATDKNGLCETGMRSVRGTLVGVEWDCSTLKAEYAQIKFRTVSIKMNLCIFLQIDLTHFFFHTLYHSMIVWQQGWPFKGMHAKYPDLCQSTTEKNDSFPEQNWLEFQATHESKALSSILKIIEQVEKDYADLEIAYTSPNDWGLVWLVIGQDISLVGISVVFVAIVLTVQTGSLFIMLCGMFEILISFPLACWVWLILLQQRGVTNLMFVAIFVILGIGADDIFVYVDAWKQSALKDKSISGSLEDRFEWAYRRAVVAMTSTSITTFFCFCVSIFSPVWDFRCFGIVCGFMILADFALVITWLPAAVIIKERYFDPCFSKLWKRKTVSPRGTSDGNGGATSTTGNNKKGRRIEIFFEGPWADFVIKNRRAIIAVWLVVFIVVIAWPAAVLRMSNKEFELVAEDNLLAKNGRFASKFRDESTFEPAKIMLLAGLKEDNPWEIGDTYPPYLFGQDGTGAAGNGKVHFNEDFNLAEEQEAFRVACSAFHEKMKENEDANRYDMYYNVMDDFASWAKWKGHGFPVATTNFGSIFNTFASAPDGYVNASMRRFREYGEPANHYMSATGFYLNENKDKVLSIWCGFNMTSLGNGWGEPYGQVAKAQARSDEALVAAKEKSKMKNIYHVCGKWLFNAMILSVTEFAITSVGISYTISVGVILCMTGNWLVSLLAGAVLLSIIGFGLTGLVMMGYDFGMNEAMVVLVAAGMSVDYLLHMAHSYNHQHGTNKERTRKALGEMGISVFSGFVTTTSASFALCLCALFGYQRLGVFLMFLIPGAFVMSVSALMALLAHVGPNDGEGMVPILGEYIHKTAGVIRKKGGGDGGGETDLTGVVELVETTQKLEVSEAPAEGKKKKEDNV